MDLQASKAGTIYQKPAHAIGLSTLRRPPIGCVLYLPGLPGASNKIYDRSPYGNIGTITGAVWKRLPSGLWCLDFDGQDDYVHIAYNSLLNPSTQITLGCWAKVPDVVGTKHLFQMWKSDTDVLDKAYLFRINGDEVDCYLRHSDDSAETGTITTTSPISADVWTQIFAISDNENLKLYVNSDELVSIAYTFNIHTSTLDLKIFRYGSATFNEGHIALPRIYNRALSALEIQNLYQREKHLFGIV